MASVLRDKKIKSADRVLEIFEMFDGRRQEVTVMEVARILDYPQSSTSELLGNLVRLGYLIRDRAARTFRPTARVALLGAWVQPTLFRQGHMLPMMDALHELTGEAVILSSIVGVQVKHVHAVGDALNEEYRSGTAHHLLQSPFGQVFMSIMYREHVRKLVHRLNAEGQPEQRIRFDDLAVILEEISKHGYRSAPIGDGLSALAMLLPQGRDQERLAIGLIARTETVENREEELVRDVRGAISQYLSPGARPTLADQVNYARAC